VLLAKTMRGQTVPPAISDLALERTAYGRQEVASVSK
jgi:hypothetical protein